MRFGIKNLRRLRDVPPIELKPITLLVGRNSSGKSSFLRLFPLLRQSLMTRTSSPILWYGDLVDFGTYSTAVSHSEKGSPIEFSFGLDQVTIEGEYFWADEGPEESPRVIYRDISYDLTIEPTDTIGPIESVRTNVSKVKLRCGKPLLEFEILVNDRTIVESLTVNGVEVAPLFRPNVLEITSGTILPELFFSSVDDERRTVSRRRRGDGEFAHLLIDVVKSFYVEEMKDEGLIDGAIRLLASRATTPRHLIATAKQIGDPRWVNFVEAACSDVNSDLFTRLYAIQSVSALSEIMKRVDAQLRQVLSGVLYIGPARARSERYYRYQDLSVSEIDPDGKNFPMFLNSLPQYRVDKL